MTKKHIYVYSPSGAVRDKVAFRRGIKLDTWLWDKSGRFQIDSVTEGQRSR